MGYDGSLKFDTAIDESGFNSGISKLGGIAKSGLSVAAGAIGGITAAMGAGVAAGVTYNAQMQDYFANFETMLGSAEAATDLVTKLKEMGASTPFEMTDLSDATKTLLAFGESTDDLMGDLQMLGDISLGNADKFSSLALVFGQVQSAGKMTGQDLNQMINSGFNPLKVISEQTGKSMADLRKEMEDGNISFEMVSDAMKTATSEGGQFYGAMEKSSQTMNGLISTLKDNAKSLLGEVIQPISDNMTAELLPAAIDAISQLSTAFQTNGVDGLIEAGAGIVTNVLVGVANALPSVIDTAVSFITTLCDSISANMEPLSTAGANIISSLVGGLITSSVQLFDLGITLLANIMQGLEQNPDAISSGVTNTIMSIVNSIATNLPTILQSGITILLAIVQGIINALPQLIPVVGQIISNIVDLLATNGPNILQSGLDLLTTFADGIINALPGLIARLPEIITGMINFFAENFPKIVSTGGEIIGKLIVGLLASIPSLVAALPEIIDSIFNAFESVNWLSIGVNLIDGIASGISEAAGGLVEQAINAARDAVEAVKGWLGIHSPSRRMRDEVGKYMAQGVGVGFENEMPAVSDDITGATNDAISAVQNAVVASNNKSASVTSPVTASDTKDNTGEQRIVVENHINASVNMDGREVGILIAPVVSEELALA